MPVFQIRRISSPFEMLNWRLPIGTEVNRAIWARGGEIQPKLKCVICLLSLTEENRNCWETLKENSVADDGMNKRWIFVSVLSVLGWDTDTPFHCSCLLSWQMNGCLDHLFQCRSSLVFVSVQSLHTWNNSLSCSYRVFLSRPVT
jgi:hypothetical protein